jgi:hypothetical protein
MVIFVLPQEDGFDYSTNRVNLNRLHTTMRKEFTAGGEFLPHSDSTQQTARAEKAIQDGGPPQSKLTIAAGVHRV